MSTNRVSGSLSRRKGLSIQAMTRIAIFTVLTAVGAFIKIPIPVCPFTLQFLFTMLAGLLLGAEEGALSVGIYVLLGLVGLPIFTEGGGFWYLIKPSFGYLIGFIVASYVTGKIAAKEEFPSLKRLLMANFLGLAIVYIFGMVYYYIICNFVIHTPISPALIFLYCFLMAVPGDILLCILAAFLTRRLKPLLANIGRI